MPQSLSEKQLLQILTVGVGNTQRFIEQATDFHGGEVQTEYLITTDIARAFLSRDYHVAVEFLNRNFVSLMTGRPKVDTTCLGAQRTDVAVMLDFSIPLAIIEVKIGVGKSIAPVSGDLDKITNTITLFHVEAAKRTIGASVFQVHLKKTNARKTVEQFKAAISRTEQSLAHELAKYSNTHPGFSFRLVPLHNELTDGIKDQEVIEYDSHSEFGRPPHATRYYSILIRSTASIPAAVSSFEALKGRSGR